MAKKKSTSGSVSVARCLNEAQRSISAHRKLVRTLLNRLAEEGAMCVLKELAPCLAHVLLVFSRDTHVERVVRFVVSFVTHAVGEDEGKRSEATERVLEEQESLIEALLSWLLTMTKATEKSVRYRSCQLIAGVLSHVPPHVSLPNTLLEELKRQMTCRLKDKVPQVRAQAARALARFQEGGDDGEFSEDAITSAYQQMVSGDRNKEVRKVVLASIAVSTHTLKSIFMHTRDTCDSVRRTAYLVLASKVPMSALTIKQRNDALRRGLRDRMPTVKQAAHMMLKQWFKETQEQLKTATGEAPRDCDTVIGMLDALDVEAYEAECELLIKELLENNLVNAVSLVKELDASEACTLKRNADECLSSACALTWRVACAAISSEAKEQGQAAALTSGTESAVHASQVTTKLDTLEQVLPASSETFVSLIDFHVQSEFGMRFVVKQLLLLACECVEFADATSRMLGEVVFKTLASERENENLFKSKVVDTDREEDYECGLFCQGSNGKWESALMKFGVKVFGSSQSCMHQLISLVMNRMGGSAEHGAEGVAPEDLVQGCMLLNTCFETCSTLGCVDLEIVPQLAEHVMGACVTHEAVAVRRESIKLCGMLMLHSNYSSESLYNVFITALRKDHYQVKTEAAKFFVDLAHLNGPKYPQHKFSSFKTIAGCPMEMLKQCLSSSDCDLLKEAGDGDDKKEFRKVVVEGFLKLMTNHSKYSRENAWTEGEQCDIFTKLVFLNFDKECGAYAPMQQCISVFFDVYSMLHAHTYQIVSASIVLTVKEAVRRELKPRVFGQLVRFLTYLVQRVPAQDKDEVVGIQQKVATSLICEMKMQASEETVWEEEEEQMEQIIPALLKVLLKLDVQQFNQDAVKIMQVLLSELPEGNKLFGTKEFQSASDTFSVGDAAEGEVAPDVQKQASLVYDQYLAMKSQQDQAPEEEDAPEEEEPAEEVEKENEEEAAADTKAPVEHKSPVRRRRALRSRNVVS
ncbi:subunit 3 of nuclear condensin complex [Chloropicon primus]|nr:subunit 3 of nuclear condensin complex [Chloropicon primus]